MAKIFLGFDCKTYYDPSGVGGSTWNEIKNVGDAKLGLEKGEADVTTREAGGWEQMVGTLKKASIEFKMQYDPTDPAFVALKNAFLQNTTIGMAFMDGDIALSGAEGFQADCAVMSFPWDQALQEAASIDVVVKPTRSSVVPDWVTIP